MRLQLVILAALLLPAAPINAQLWTTRERTVSWVTSPATGDGVDRHPEVAAAAQGGDPPALAYEPAPIDENGLYTRSQWFGGTPQFRTTVSPKFRITCNFSHFGFFDPIMYPGQTNVGHHHTYIGNKHTDENSSYTSLRNSPASTCSGGPVNGTAYWEPSLMYESATGVFVPVKPNVVSFYYTIGSHAVAAQLYRLLRGLAFIGGVDPMDRLNTARLGEIPDGRGWLKTRRYNGWNGWGCYNGGRLIQPAAGNTADPNPQQPGLVRQLVNADGSDPWSGACENAGYILIASVGAPQCWDGYNLTSPNGRDHFRYHIFKSSNQAPGAEVCPDGWWRVPAFEAKSEFANARPGLSGHAWRSRLHLSSDRMDPNPANWHPRGSTFHFDWMHGWDTVVMNTWLVNCTGVSINGTAGDGHDCNDSTISPTQKLLLGASPDTSLSNSPVVNVNVDYSAGPSRDAVGPVETGTTVPEGAIGRNQ